MVQTSAHCHPQNCSQGIPSPATACTQRDRDACNIIDPIRVNKVSSSSLLITLSLATGDSYTNHCILKGKRSHQGRAQACLDTLSCQEAVTDIPFLTTYCIYAPLICAGNASSTYDWLFASAVVARIFVYLGEGAFFFFICLPLYVKHFLFNFYFILHSNKSYHIGGQSTSM